MVLMQDKDNLKKLAEYFIDPSSLIDITATTAKAVAIGEALVVFLFLFVLCYNYVDTWIKEGHRGKFYNPAELKRSLWIPILVILIPTILWTIWGLGATVAGQFEMDSAAKAEAMKQLNEKVLGVADKEEFSVFNLSMNVVLDGLATGVMFLSLLMMYVVRFIVSLFVGVFAKYLIVVSPLAAAFSIIPIFKDQAQKLISVFANAAFVVVTLNILESIFFDSILSNVVNTMGSPDTWENAQGILFNKILITTLCITISILYLLSIWLTSKFIGSPGAAAVLAMATTVSTIAAAAMLKAASAGAGGGAGAVSGAGSGGKIGNVAKEGAKGLRES